MSLEVRHWPGPAAFLLVHGLASNARTWDGVAERLAAAGRGVVAVDQRGHGRSDKPDDGYDFATLTGDLVTVVTALNMAPVVAVGQSWGGNVVVELAACHGAIVRGVAGVDGGTIELSQRFDSWADASKALSPPHLEGMLRDKIEDEMRRMHGDWPEAGIQGALANFETRDDGTVAPWLSRDRHMRILRELWHHRPSAVLPTLTAPVLLVDATDHGADHDIHAQKPDLVARLLLERFP
ncbi:MAG: alpha/beta fold hydrolase [Actinobacteria bacterium]|nr:alpha/beta fold hydrolase [Actinomycetota bacterium]